MSVSLIGHSTIGLIINNYIIAINFSAYMQLYIKESNFSHELHNSIAIIMHVQRPRMYTATGSQLSGHYQFLQAALNIQELGDLYWR